MAVANERLVRCVRCSMPVRWKFDRTSNRDFLFDCLFDLINYSEYRCSFDKICSIADYYYSLKLLVFNLKQCQLDPLAQIYNFKIRCLVPCQHNSLPRHQNQPKVTKFRCNQSNVEQAHRTRRTSNVEQNFVRSFQPYK